jgi:uncharacterized radical SAM superfamily Fe-S cluster-containing enzyme
MIPTSSECHLTISFCPKAKSMSRSQICQDWMSFSDKELYRRFSAMTISEARRAVYDSPYLQSKVDGLIVERDCSLCRTRTTLCRVRIRIDLAVFLAECEISCSLGFFKQSDLRRIFNRTLNGTAPDTLLFERGSPCASDSNGSDDSDEDTSSE